MDEKATRMLFATLALSALAVVLAGPANAYIDPGDGVHAVSAQSQQQQQSQAPFDGQQATRRLPGPHGALQLRQEKTAAASLPHGIQVVLSPPSEPQSLGLTGDAAFTRTAPASQPVGLSGDSAATRYLRPVSTPSTPTVSSGNDFDWMSFGAGAGTVALLAAALGGALLTVRKRHSVGLP